MENNRNSFWRFSDQLRLQTSTLANLSLNDSIWTTSSGSKRPEDRRNIDFTGISGGDHDFSFRLNKRESGVHGTEDATRNNYFGLKSLEDRRNSIVKVNADINSVIGGFKQAGVTRNGSDVVWKAGLNEGFAKGVYLDDGGIIGGNSFKNSSGGFIKGTHSKLVGPDRGNNVNVTAGKDGNFTNSEGDAWKSARKNVSGNRSSSNGGIGNEKSSADKRFKTLPASESLPRNQTVGGYIFVCNNDTMQENLQRQLFGLPPRYRDSVRAITPGLPLFLYNYSTHQLHGIFEAASFGGTNIDSSAWEDKKNRGESRFPAQVRVVTRKVYEPLEEDSFRPILHHYDGPKFRLELNVPETISLLDVFQEG